MSSIKPSCVICAWRATCQKQFSITNPSTCPDFTLDVAIKDYPGKKGVKLLIEGEPGIGKTTLVERLIVRLKDVRAGGFVTREIRESGERRGYRIISLDKHEGVLAHVELSGSYKVGKYTVNLEDLEKVGVKAIERALRDDQVIIIDEIGKMELMSPRFPEMVEFALRSDKPLVATVPADGPPFVEEIKKRSDIHLIRLTKENRDTVIDEVVAHVIGDVG